MNGEADVPMLDLTVFSSPEDAFARIQRHNGFDDLMKRPLKDIIDRAGGLTAPVAVVMSATSRARALYEAIVREIASSNPQAVFTLIRQFAETLAVYAYTSDHLDYIDSLIGNADRKPIRVFINHMNDSGYTSNCGAVYGNLSDLAHYGPAVWNPFSIVKDEPPMVEFRWRSQPRWRNEREMLIACAYMMELGSAMEWALIKLGKAVYKNTEDAPVVGSLDTSALESQ